MQTRVKLGRIPLLLSVILSVSGCHSETQSNESSPSVAQPAPSPAPPKQLPTFRLEPSLLESTLQLPAELIADRKVEIYAKVNSYVKDLRFDIGARVRKGDLLVQLEAPEIEAQLASAKARWNAFEATHVASKATYERVLQTSSTEGAIARDAIDQAQAKEQADAAQALAAKANYEELSAMTSYLVVRAPFDGVITDRNVELGAYVGPSGKGSHQAMFVLQSIDQMRVTVSIPETYLPYVRLGDTLQFSVRTLPGRLFTAQIKRKSGALDPALRAERIEADLDNDAHLLLPLMVVDARVSLSSPAPTLLIPRTALVESGMGTYVLRVRDGKANRVPVSKGVRVNEKIEIFGELTAGDRLILKANEEIQDGMPVVEG